jgi:small subunit ribosomal protein S17
MELPTDVAHRKVRVGRVVSNKMEKTVVVEVVSYRHHRVYKKRMRSTERVKAHDETNRCVIGDEVRLVESRPISKEKRWIVHEVLTKGHGAVLRPAEIDSTLVSRPVDAESSPAPASGPAEPEPESAPAEGGES